MYPMVPVLGFMLVTRNRAAAYLVLCGSLLGQGVSVYHYLLQKTMLLTAADTCGGGVPCSLIYIDWGGVVTIPLLAMIAFMLITVGVLVYLGQFAECKGVPEMHDRQAVKLVFGITLLGALVWLGIYFGGISSSKPSESGVTSPSLSDETASLPGTSVLTDRGAMLFNENCAVCHGQNGIGVPTLTPSLQSSVRVRELNEDQIAELIRLGVTQEDPQNQTGNAMPPGGGADLSDKEMESVVAFLKSQVES